MVDDYTGIGGRGAAQSLGMEMLVTPHIQHKAMCFLNLFHWHPLRLILTHVQMGFRRGTAKGGGSWADGQLPLLVLVEILC